MLEDTMKITNQRVRSLGRALVLGIGLATVATGQAAVLFDQMSNPTATIIPSSWYAPDGLDGDTYSWDNFMLKLDSSVREVWWIGGGGNISGVSVRFYEGLPAAPDYQPKITALPESETSNDYLKGYKFTLSAMNATPLGNGLYKYHVTLPQPLHLPGKTVFWIKIEGDGSGSNSWGVVQSTHGRDAMHFRFITGYLFQRITGSLGFQLVGNPTTLSLIGPRP